MTTGARTKATTLLLLGCLMAAALSGGCATPAAVASVALDGLERGAMRRQLAQAMRGHGLAAAAGNAQAGAEWRLEIVEFTEDRRVLRINRRAREAEVLLRGQLRVRIGHIDGEAGERGGKSMIRQYQAERRQVLLRPDGDAAQERQLRGEIRAELAARAASDTLWVMDSKTVSH